MGRIGPGVRGGKQFFEQKHLTILRDLPVRCVTLAALPPKEISDSVAGDPEQPGGDLFDWFHHPVRFHEFLEDVLEDVFGIAGTGHAPPNETPEPRPLSRNRFGDLLVLALPSAHCFLSSSSIYSCRRTRERDILGG